MALAKMTWDELNQLVGYKISEPFDEYYEPMRITEEQKRKRIELAERLYEVFLALLVECFYADQFGTVIPSDIYARTRDAYIEAVNESVSIDDYIYDHAIEIIESTILILNKHDDEPFYYSDDRSMAIAENDANSIWNYEEFQEAYEEGYRYKTWNTIMDGKERESHAEINGTTIRIDELFELPGGLMAYPRSDEYGASDDEIINCRCSLEYS